MNISATKTSFTNISVNFQSLPKVLSFGFPKKDLICINDFKILLREEQMWNP